MITDFAFDKCYNLLTRPDFGEDFFAMVQTGISMIWIYQQWPIIQETLYSIPESWIKRWGLGMRDALEFRQVLKNHPYITYQPRANT